MIDWKFNPDNVENTSYEPIPVGNYRVRIDNVEEGIGKKEPHYPQYKITLKVSGDNRKLWYYINFMDGEKAKYTDMNLKSLWDSFDIPVGELDYRKWIGKVGAAKVKHRIYNGEPQAEINYFIHKDKQNNLPPWQEDEKPVLSIDDDFSLLDDDDEIPF